MLANFKIAAGVFEKDRYLALIQGGVNLVLSIGLVQVIGLSGIYAGTVVSGLMANVIQPLIVYHDCFERKAISYFTDSLKYLCIIVGITLLLLPVKAAILQEVTFLRFLGMAVVITLVYNGVFWLAFGRSGEFRYLFQVVAGKFVKKK